MRVTTKKKITSWFAGSELGLANWDFKKQLIYTHTHISHTKYIHIYYYIYVFKVV